MERGGRGSYYMRGAYNAGDSGLPRENAEGVLVRPPELLLESSTPAIRTSSTGT